ncbi:serine protease [Chitinispirillum alkaliphilum]|nr:serine protease [Chitinispirillum alkaliphilum]
MTIITIPISGTVDNGMAAFVERALYEASEHENPVVILKMDTFGGQVDASFRIVDTIVNYSSGPTYSLVTSKAISAGALIALAADQLYMQNNTTIGDVAPLIMSNEGPQMLGEKFQSPIRAKFRALARRNDYPEVLTEAMVTKEIQVTELTLPDTVIYVDSIGYAELDETLRNRIISQRTVVRKGELLTMTDAEALELGFSRKSVGSIDEMLQHLEYDQAQRIEIEESWSETMVRFLGSIAPFLMMIGFAALYIELRSPGFGVPGIIGAVCLAAVFFGQYMVGLANHTELLLVILGVVFLAMEIFVTPGFGFMGLLGIFFMMAGMVLSFQNFVIPDPQLPWQREILFNNIIRVASSILGSLILIVLFFRYLFPKLGTVVSGPYLNATLEGARADSDVLNLPKRGDTGVAKTTLRPCGTVWIGNEIYDASTDGEFISSGTEITISEIRGSKIIVTRKADS